MDAQYVTEKLDVSRISRSGSDERHLLYDDSRRSLHGFLGIFPGRRRQVGTSRDVSSELLEEHLCFLITRSCLHRHDGLAAVKTAIQPACILRGKR